MTNATAFSEKKPPSLLLYDNVLWIYSTEGMLPKMPLRPFIMARNFVMNNDIDFFSNIVRHNNYILS